MATALIFAETRQGVGRGQGTADESLDLKKRYRS